jgi:hypothetical protein
VSRNGEIRKTRSSAHGHELAGTSVYWADVAAWLTSERLR